MTEEADGSPRQSHGRTGRETCFCSQQTSNKIVWNVLGALRLELAEQMGLLDKNEYRFVWITEFPLLEWSDEENRFTGHASPVHHADGRRSGSFWIPIRAAVRAKAYDIVLNGTEIGGGSRSYPPE